MVKKGWYIKYINEQGNECSAFVAADAVARSYYSSRKDSTGHYPKIEVSALSDFLSKLKNCHSIKAHFVEEEV